MQEMEYNFPLYLSKASQKYMARFHLVVFGGGIFVMAMVGIEWINKWDFMVGLIMGTNLISVGKYYFHMNPKAKLRDKLPQGQGLKRALLEVVAFLLILGSLIYLIETQLRFVIEQFDEYTIAVVSGSLVSLITGLSLISLVKQTGIIELNANKPAQEISAENKPWWRNWENIVAIPLLGYMVIFHIDFGFLGTALRPCGWIDKPLHLSGCAQRFSTEGPINLVFLSEDGKILVGFEYRYETEKVLSEDGKILGEFGYRVETVKVWNFDENKFIAEHDFESGIGWFPVDFSLDGNSLALWVSSGGIALWDLVRDDVQILVSAGEIEEINGFEFSPDGQYLLYQDNGKLIAISSGKNRQMITTTLEEDAAVDFRSFYIDEAGHRLLFVTEAFNVFAWQFDNPAGAQLVMAASELPFAEIMRTTFDEHGNLIVVGYADKKMMIWRHGDLQELIDVGEHLWYGADTKTMGYSANGEMFAFGYGDEIRVWQTADGELVQVIDTCRFPCIYNEDREIRELYFLDGQQIAVRNLKELQIWDIQFRDEG
ncbi:MAG: WD40 repeat domain-containing protein [Anaerolineae bacterium]|nr:WD40 repeat domain-containing protein [Anaerolineae bacterium]